VATARTVELAAPALETHLLLVAAPQPSAEALARRGALAGATGTLGAFLRPNRAGRPELTLWLLGAGGGNEGRRTLVADATLTTAALAAAIDALLGDGAALTASQALRPAPPWWKRAWPWAVGAGVAGAAVGLGVGLGVGLAPHGQGLAAHVDLGPAR
jgi:hypothetical protein